MESRAVSFPCPPLSDYWNWFYVTYGTKPITAISNQDSLSYISCDLCRHRRDGLIDTGARVCTIDLCLLPPSLHTRIRPTAVRLKAANGTRLHCSGIILIEFSIGKFKFSHPFFVVRNLQFSLILGLDFYVRFGLDLMYGCGELQGTLNGARVTISQICYDLDSPIDRAPARPALQCKQTTRRRPLHRTSGLPSSTSSEMQHQLPMEPDAPHSHHAAVSTQCSPPPDGRQSAAPTGPQLDNDYTWLCAVDFPAIDPAANDLSVFSQVETTIPPYTKKFVPISLPPIELDTRYWLLTPSVKLKGHKLIVEDCLITRQQRILPITNYSPYPTTIARNMLLGCLSSDFDFLPDKPEPLEIFSILTSHSIDDSGSSTSPAPTNPEKKVFAQAPPPGTPMDAAESKAAQPNFDFNISPNLTPRDQERFRAVLRRFQHCFVVSESEVGLMKNVPESRLSTTDDRIIRTPPTSFPLLNTSS